MKKEKSNYENLKTMKHGIGSIKALKIVENFLPANQVNGVIHIKQLLTLKESLGNINKPADLFRNIKTISIDYSQEHFLVFYLDTRNVLIDTEVVFKGGLNITVICPKTLFRKALLKKSNSIIVAHNHPSGNLKPSDEDMTTFRDLQKAGELIDVPVLDSIIFNERSFYAMSMR